MRFAVDSTVFERFPGYRRGVVVARGSTNRTEDSHLEARLRAAEEAVRARFDGGDWRTDPRIAAWLRAFGALGVGVGSRPPSVAALVKRVVKGGEVPFVSQLVALMNVVSLENLVPCGGDDLATVGDELVLRPAAGGEAYRPLGRPDVLEHPDAGELVLLDVAHGVVLCRTWCWRNSDVTKLTGSTTAVALNVDLLEEAVPTGDGDGIVESLAADLEASCGGTVEWHMLTPAQPAVRVAAGGRGVAPGAPAADVLCG